MRVLMVSDVYFPRVNGVSTSIETFRRTLSAHGVEVKLVVPRYGNELYEPGIVRVAGRPVPGDREDRLVGWRAMHRAVLEAAQDCDLIHVQTPFIAHYAGLKAARKLGLPVVVSSAVETSIGLRAGLALAAALPELPYACGLETGRLLGADLVSRPLVPVAGLLTVRDVEGDPELLARHAAGPELTRFWLDRWERVRRIVEEGR